MSTNQKCTLICALSHMHVWRYTDYIKACGIASDLNNFPSIISFVEQINITAITVDVSVIVFLCVSIDSGYVVAIVTATIVYMVFYFIAVIWIFFADYIW